MKLLFLCAHPDDLEFYVGHLLYALGQKNESAKGLSFISRENPKESLQFKIASMTRGEMSYFTKKIQSSQKAAKIRTEELISALNQLGCPSPEFLGFFDGFIQITPDTIERIRDYIQKISPDVIIAPEPVFTWYHHQDHKITGKLVYYALQKWHTTDPQVKKPLLYYFTGLFHHYYFPKYPEWTGHIQKALDQHRSQSELLNQGRIADFITSLYHGFHIEGHRFAHALRRQYRPRIDPPWFKQKLMTKWTFFKRILYFILKNLLSRFEDIDYSYLYEYIDGTLANSQYPPLLPNFFREEDI
jgi:LmbE family N-acetylglucosaminyl deacetylase